MRFILIVFFVILFSIYNCAANSYIFRKYSVDNGLSENTARVIIQDKKGFMWVGTKDGLNRFDGYSNKIYKRDSDNKFAIGSNFIISLYQDKNDNIWVGTDAGIYLFDYYTERFTFFNKSTKGGTVIKSPVMAICTDADGKLWIGTDRQGLFSYDTNNDVLSQYTTETAISIPANTVSNIFVDNANSVWIGTREGFGRYNRESQSFRFYTFNTHPNLKDVDVLSIFQDSDGTMWFGSWSGGLVALNKQNDNFDIFFSSTQKPYISHIRKIFEYKKGQLMIGADDGLYLFDKHTQQCSRIDNPNDSRSLSDQNVYDIYKDREGGLWIGTYFGGVNYLPANSEAIMHIYPGSAPNSLSGKAISQFYEDSSGNLWIATEDGGLNYFNTRTLTFEPIPLIKKGVSYHNIHTLLIDNDKLWIGTFSRGIDVFDFKTRTFKNYRTKKDDPHSLNDNCVFSIYKTRDGRIYAGTPFGLSVYNKGKDTFDRLKEPVTFAYDIIEDHLKQLWIASYFDGVYCYNPETKKWKHYKHQPNNPKSIGLDKVIKIYLDDKQQLWFALEGGGISKYSYRSDSFTTINMRNGLPNDVVYGILDDKYGNIWISTNKGISKIDTETLEIETYTKSDGLQGDQFNYRSAYKSTSGIMYFGGLNGFNIIDINKLDKNAYIPTIAITDIKTMSGQSKFVTPEIVIDPKTGKKKITLQYNTSLNIHFVSLSYAAPDKNQYAYQMTNIAPKWINIGTQKSVSFVNLAPGVYTFKVRGTNNDGVWNEDGDTLIINVLPPFWRTNIAYAIYILLGITVFYITITYLQREDKRKHAQKLDEFKREKDKESLDARINFFNHIAHEIRTPLSLIKAPLELIIKSQDGNRETKDNLSVIEKNTDRLLELINQLLDFKKIGKTGYTLQLIRTDIKKLLENIIFRFEKTAAQKNITLEVNLPEGNIFLITDKDALTKIISNLLNNALKYTHNKISIDLETDYENIILKIADNGIGIPDGLQAKIFEPFFQVADGESVKLNKGCGLGLALVKELTEYLNGTITVSKTDKGALFVLSFPTDTESAFSDQDSNIAIIKDTDFDYKSQITDNKKKKQLLIVEDNKELRDFLKNSLGDYEVITAENGKQGFEAMEQYNIDIIISDVLMPEVNGLEFTNTIKNNELYSHIPIILLSAKTITDSKIEGLEIGADFYIEKPFSINYLKAQIASILENQKRIIEKFTKSPLTPFDMETGNRRDVGFLNKLNDVIEKNMSDSDFSIEKLASTLAVSRSNLQRKIKGISGMPPNDYIRVIRLKKAARLLITGDYQINEVCYLVGFNNASYFSKCFQKQFGVLPKDFVNSEKQNKE